VARDDWQTPDNEIPAIKSKSPNYLSTEDEARHDIQTDTAMYKWRGRKGVEIWKWICEFWHEKSRFKTNAPKLESGEKAHGR